MPRWFKLAAGWTLAAVLAVALSWTAVAQVRNRVIQPSTPIPATTLVADSEGGTTLPPVIRLEPEPATSTSTILIEPDQGDRSTSSMTTTTAATGGQTTSPPTTSTPTSTQPPTTAETTSTTTPSTATTSTTTPPASPTTTTLPQETQTSSYQVIGGTVTISYSPGVVTFISAIPQPGFSTDIRDTGPDRVRIRFESDDHTSEFRAEWENGELRITKDEDGES